MAGTPPTRRAAPRTLRRARAFTLIELIVVVLIIAALAAVAAVAYNQYASRARSNSALASATDLRTAVMAAAARDDHTAADETALLWDQAGQDSATFLSALSAHYDGSVTFTAAQDGTTPSLLVGSPGSGTHTACLLLTEPPTVHGGGCGDGPGSGGAPADPTIRDDFNRPDGPLGVTSDGKQAWLVAAGTPTISGGRTSGANLAVALVELGSTDQDVQATEWSSNSSTSWGGVVFWAQDGRNYWYANAGSGGRFYLTQVVDGALHTLATWGGNYGTIEVRTAGTTVTVTDNGTVVGTYTAQGPPASATKAGFMAGGPAQSGIDDFTARAA